MEAVRQVPPRRRVETGQRLLVAVALAFNSLYALMWLTVDRSFNPLPIALFVAPPAAVFAVYRFPRAFRLLAGLFGIAYAGVTVLTAAVGVMMFVPAALCLLAAALAPSAPDDPARLTHCRVTALAVLAGAAALLAVVLVVAALLG